MSVKTNINILSENYQSVMSLSSFEQVVGNSPLANLICLEDGTILFANHAASEYFGYNEQEILQKNIKGLFQNSSFFFSADADAYKQPVQGQAQLKTGELKAAEIYCNSYDAGGEKRINLLILDTAGKNTEQKPSEDSDFDLSFFLDNSEEFIMVINRNFELLHYNKLMADRAKEKAGVELKKGISSISLLAMDKAQELKVFYERAFKGERVEFESSLELEKGELSFYRTILKPVPAKNGSITAVFVSTKNITQEKEAMRLVATSEQRLRFALEGTQQGVWDWHLESDKVYYSRAWKKIIGYEEDEISNSNDEFVSRLHPEDKIKIEHHIQQHLESPDPFYESEYRLLSKNGAYKWILSRGMIIERDAEGKPTRVIGTITDITERKNIEERFKLLFYNNPLPMWIYNRETLRFLDVNNAAVYHYGYSREEFLKMTILDIRPEEDTNLVRESVKIQEGNKTIREKRWRHRKKNGEIIYVNISGQVFDDAEKNITLVLAEDVTETVEAEEKLKASEKKYKTLFRDNPLPSYIYDTESLRFLEINEAASKFYGYRPAEFLKMSLLDIHLPEYHQKLRQSLKKNNLHGVSRISGWKQVKKSGEEIVVDLSSSQMNYNGLPARLVTINDVTEKVKAEDDLKQINKRFEFVLHATSDIIWEWNLRNETVIWSDNYTNIMGWKLPQDGLTTVDEITLKTHPDDVSRVRESVWKAVNDPACSIWEDDFRFERAGGTFAYIKNKGFIVRDNNGEALKVIGAMQDITDRRLREQELTESNERFQLATQATSDVIYDWDLTSNYLKWSSSLYTVFGWHEHEVTMEKLEKLIHNEDRAYVMKCIGEFIEDRSRSHFKEHYRLKKKDGTYSDVLDRAFIIRNEKGEPVRMIGAVQDITEIKAKERELTQSNERFELAARAASEVLWEVDFESKTTYISPVFKDLFGFHITPATYYKNWSDFIHPDDREGLWAALIAALNNPKISQFQNECRHIRADGTYAYLETHLLVIRNSAGTVTKLVGAIQDITNRKKAQEEIIKTNERFRFAADATSDIIWDLDIKEKRILLSDNYRRVFGWEIPEDKHLDYTYLLSNIHPEDRDAVNKGLADVINDPEKDIWNDEFRYLKADGSYAYVLDKGFIVRDNEGKAERVIGAVQDISERKYLEELQALELRVFEVSAVPGIHFHNVLKTLMNGYEGLHTGIHTAICLIGLNDEVEILAPKLAKEHCRQLRYFIEKQKNKLQVNHSAHKNIIISSVDSEDWKYGIDTANHFNWKVSWTIPVYHHTGDLLAFITIFLDQAKAPSDLENISVTRLRNLLRILIVNHLSLEQIRISNERYYNVQKATHDMVWDWNLETGIFYRNAEGVKKVYGVDDVDSIQNVYSWMERIHPEDHITVQNVINNILHATDEDSFDVEYRYKRDDGSYSFIYDRGIIVRNKEGKPLRMIGAAQDVTESKRLEQELLEKELEKQRSISQATIDTQEEERREIGKELHDNVNQVLTTTKLYLDLSASSPELKDELIKKSSKNIIYVINEIRQLSRSLMDPSIGDLGLIDSINDLVDNINITRKLHVSLSADSEIEKYLEESQKLMAFRIIQEAMNNTIKYAQATSVHISIKNNAGTAELIITDDGKGFHPETVKKGAGLKNIQNRVYLANGKLLIDSAPGKGTKIVINFPITNKKSN